ncbi:unnamed protein product, partial [Sphagnum compactum]
MIATFLILLAYASVLQACTKMKALAQGKQIHAHLLKRKWHLDIFLGNNLLNMYTQCGSLPDACKLFDEMHRRNIDTWNAMIRGFAEQGHFEDALTDARGVFDGMQKQDVVSWNAMIAGYSRQNLHEDAFSLFDEMQTAGIVPTKFTMTSILGACCSPAALEQGKQIHACCSKAGFESDIRVGTALVSMYAKCGSVVDAKKVFDKMPTRNTFSWTAMIRAYAQEGMYAKCGSMEDAHRIFDSMPQRNVVSWTAMISGYAQQNHIGYAQHGRGKEAIQLFEWMKREGVKPDSLTFTGLLTACSHVGLVEEGRCYFRSITQDYGITPAMQHYGSMVDLLGRAGRLDEAADFIEKMPFEADASVWGALLGACKIHCNVELAECAAKRLL